MVQPLTAVHHFFLRLLTRLQASYSRAVQGLSNATRRQSTIVGAAKQGCQEPNTAADGAMIKLGLKARLALAAIISVASRAKRVTPSRITKFSVDSVSIGSAPRNIDNLVDVPHVPPMSGEISNLIA